MNAHDDLQVQASGSTKNGQNPCPGPLCIYCTSTTWCQTRTLETVKQHDASFFCSQIWCLYHGVRWASVQPTWNDTGKHEYIRQKLRELGRFLLCSRKTTSLKTISVSELRFKKPITLIILFTHSNFNLICRETRFKMTLFVRCPHRKWMFKFYKIDSHCVFGWWVKQMYPPFAYFSSICALQGNAPTVEPVCKGEQHPNSDREGSDQILPISVR